LYAPKQIEEFTRQGIAIRLLACGSYHTACVSTTGKMYVFGGGLHGKLGMEEACPVPRLVPGFADKKVLSVACGSRHTVALVSCPDLPGNQVYSFGEASVCGHGVDEGQQSTPRLVEALRSVNTQQIAACGFHTLALGGDGTVWAFGDGRFGRLGVGSEAAAHTPLQIPPHILQNVVWIAAGGFHSAAVDEMGHAYTWGGGEHGATATGNVANQLLPVKVSTLSDHTLIQVRNVVVRSCVHRPGQRVVWRRCTCLL
jgi:RCC1 and BTB domain-containing protein